MDTVGSELLMGCRLLGRLKRKSESHTVDVWLMSLLLLRHAG
jgi:hypothetical protein